MNEIFHYLAVAVNLTAFILGLVYIYKTFDDSDNMTETVITIIFMAVNAFVIILGTVDIIKILIKYSQTLT